MRAAGLQASLGVILALGAAFVGPIVFRMVFRVESFHGAESLLPGLGILLFMATLDYFWLSVLIGRNRIWVAVLNLVPVLATKIILGPILISKWGADGMVFTALMGQIPTSILGAVTASLAFLLPRQSSSANRQ